MVSGKKTTQSRSLIHKVLGLGLLLSVLTHLNNILFPQGFKLLSYKSYYMSGL